MKAGWTTKRLGAVLEVQNGYAFDSKRFNSSRGLPLVRIRSLKSGVETETRFDGEYDERYLVRPGDLLIGMDGEFGCYEWKGEVALLNQRVCRLHGFSGELIPRFLLYGVNGYLKAIEDVTGYSTVKHLSSKQILAIEFPLPPLPEQRRIVALLDEAFAGLATATANAERNLDNARELFESHLAEVFSRRGDGWVERRLAELAENMDSRRVPITKGQRKAGPYPYYGASGVVDHVADYIFDGDALLISEDGANLLARSTPIAFSVSGRYWVNNHAHVLCFDDLDTQRYVEYYFESISVAEFVRGAAQPKLTQKALNAILVPLPSSVGERKAIVAELDSVSAESQRLSRLYEQRQAALADLKRSLLHQAFSGNL